MKHHIKEEVVLLFGIAVCAFAISCSTTSAFQTISATETSVLAANRIFLDQVVTGQVPTNNVPIVEAAFNDTQLALHAAAVAASGGGSAPVPAAVLTKATSFTNIVTSAGVKL